KYFLCIHYKNHCIIARHPWMVNFMDSCCCGCWSNIDCCIELHAFDEIGIIKNKNKNPLKHCKYTKALVRLAGHKDTVQILLNSISTSSTTLILDIHFDSSHTRRHHQHPQYHSHDLFV